MAFQSDRRIRQVIAIQIDPNFLRQLSAGQQAAVQVIADGRNSNTTDAALGYVGSAVESFNADWRSDHGLPQPPIQVITRAWYCPNLENRLSARDPDTDRRHKLLIPNGTSGSQFAPNNTGRTRNRRSPTRALRGKRSSPEMECTSCAEGRMNNEILRQNFERRLVGEI
jgi:hypothetical protein